MFDISIKEFDTEKDIDLYIEAYLQRAGIEGFYNRIGSGSFGTVYSNDSDTVVKITHGQDRAYFAYLKMIHDLGFENPYIPKIKEVILFRVKDTEYTIYPELSHVRMMVQMERLQESFKNYDYRRVAAANIAKMLTKFVCPKWDDEKDEYSDQPPMECDELRQEHQDLIALLRLMHETYPTITYDIRTSNIMVRGRQLVVTDPVSCLGDT